MKGKSFLVLVAIAGLAFLLWRKKEAAIESGGPRLAQYPLWTGFVRDRVSAVRIDHVQRGVQIKLERDAHGSWFLTDPIAYPAVDSLVAALLRALASSLGSLDTQAAPAEVGLDPPLIVLELTQVPPEAPEESPEESTREPEVLRIELGHISLDPDRIFSRIPGHPAAPPGRDAAVLRVPRTLFNTLDRNPNDYRERRITHLRGTNVTGFARRGAVHLGGEDGHVELAFEARIEEGGWMRTDGQRARLGDEAMAIVTRAAAEVKAEDFLDDAPRTYAPWGLDPPLFSVDLTERDGSVTTLHFGHLPVEEAEPDPKLLTWTCRREGFAQVWQVPVSTILLVGRPANQLYDGRLVRLRRGDVARLELEAGGRTLVLERDRVRGGSAGPWRVTDVGGGASDATDGDRVTYEAQPGAIEDVLAALEEMELGDVPGVPFERAAGEAPLGFRIGLFDGRTMGGVLGRPWRDAQSGADGRLYRREGDELASWVPEALGELLHRPLEDFRARTLFRVGREGKEAEVSWIEVASGETTYRYVNDGRNRWLSRNKVEAPAAFVAALERGLLSLQATDWLAPDGVSDPAQEVSLWVKNTYGGDLRFVLGRTEEGLTYCRTAEGRLAEVPAPVVDELFKLFPG